MAVIVGAFCVWAVPAVAGPPADTAAPTISGTARVGETHVLLLSSCPPEVGLYGSRGGAYEGPESELRLR
jgi:hypothetical protein